MHSLSSLPCKQDSFTVARGSHDCSWKCSHLNHSDRPVTSDWKLPDWPVKQTAANKDRQPRLSVSFSSPLHSCFHNTAILSLLLAIHWRLIPGYCTFLFTFDYSWTTLLFLSDHSHYSEPEERQGSQWYHLQTYPGAASLAVNRRSSLWMQWKYKAS